MDSGGALQPGIWVPAFGDYDLGVFIEEIRIVLTCNRTFNLVASLIVYSHDDRFFRATFTTDQATDATCRLGYYDARDVSIAEFFPALKRTSLGDNLLVC